MVARDVSLSRRQITKEANLFPWRFACFASQLPVDFHSARRHSAGSTSSSGDSAAASSWPPRRRSLEPRSSSPAAILDSGEAREDALNVGGCRRRSFSVTPKGDIVNEGDEILPLQGSFRSVTANSPQNYVSMRLFSFLASSHPSGRPPRSTDTSSLLVPLTCRATIGDRAFTVAAARAWNSLTPRVRTALSVVSFRRELNTFLFSQLYSLA